MDTNYDIQTVSDELTDEMEPAHTKAYEEAKPRTSQDMDRTLTLIFAKSVTT